MSMATSPIGDNLARVRKARGLTQEDLAAASGVSVDVIARLEQGRKKGARWSTLVKLANALGVQLPVLVTPPALLGVSHDRVAGDDITALRQTITSCADLLDVGDLADNHETVPLETISHTVDRAWAAYHRGEFTAVARALPTLVGDARRVVHDSNHQRAAAAHTVLATCYCMAAGITVMRGHQDLALTAVERALSSARQADGPLPAAAAAVFLSWILLKQGRYTEAERAAVTAAGQVEPRLTDGTRTQLATFGNLIINASCAAIRNGATTRATELLDVARAAASRYGTDGIDQWSVFGPRVVAMYAANNAAEHRDIDAALRHAARVPPANGGRLPDTWEARHLLSMAHIHSEAGEDATAVQLLTQARRTAPEWITYHPLAATVVLEQLARPRKPSTDLADLATHLRVL